MDPMLLERYQEPGFEIRVNPNCLQKHLVFRAELLVIRLKRFYEASKVYSSLKYMGMSRFLLYKLTSFYSSVGL